MTERLPAHRCEVPCDTEKVCKVSRPHPEAGASSRDQTTASRGHRVSGCLGLKAC
ncbi:hypothetical protein LEMLEM_LOCUS149, partial [Lemmus lemmus]